MLQNVRLETIVHEHTWFFWLTNKTARPVTVSRSGKNDVKDYD